MDTTKIKPNSEYVSVPVDVEYWTTDPTEPKGSSKINCPSDPVQEPFPFVINVKTIAGQSVKDTCHAAVRLSKRLGCLVETEINDVTITVGGLMTEQDAYESWLFYSKQKQ